MCASLCMHAGKFVLFGSAESGHDVCCDANVLESVCVYLYVCMQIIFFWFGSTECGHDVCDDTDLLGAVCICCMCAHEYVHVYVYVYVYVKVYVCVFVCVCVCVHV
jgi:hypothetical protein